MAVAPTSPPRGPPRQRPARTIQGDIERSARAMTGEMGMRSWETVLTATATVIAIESRDGVVVADFDVETRNQAGVTVFHGSATARLD